MLLIERARRLGDPWSGQIAFPGGRRDPDDRRLSDTALRELGEEVGLGPEDLAGPPAYFGTFPTQSAELRVAAFAGAVLVGAHRAAARDPSEVAEVFWSPLDRFRHPVATRLETTRGWREVDAVAVGRRTVWGFTLRVLRELDLGLRNDPGPVESSR